MRSVVKHKYINGGKKGKAQARAHLNYIEHRDGPDRVQGGRPFFDRDQDETDPSGFKKSIEDSKQRNVLMHKLILSPGINGIDLKEYTREIMTELEDHKGMELDWQAVIHSNTDHEHVHLVILGKSQKGKVLSIKRSDHDVIRAVGDRYLERKHEFDRYCNKTVDHILRDETQNKNIDLDKLMKPFSLELEEKDDKKKASSRRGKKEKKQEKSLYEDSQAQLPTRRKPRRQRLMENRGRNDFFHDLYVSNTNKVRLEKLREARPELGPDIDKQVESQTGHDAERRANIEKHVYLLDRILGIKTAKKRDKKKEPEKDQKKGPDRNEIDLRKVDAKDKIHLKNGDVISKYDNLDYLSSVNQQLKEGPAGNRLSRDDYARMSSWMRTKQERGDDAYGEAPKLSPKEKEQQYLQELVRGLNENLKGLDPEKDRAQIQKLKSDYFERMVNKDSNYRKLAPDERLKDTQKSEFRYREASHLKEKITKGDPKGKEQTKAIILEHFKRNRSRKKLVKPERTSVLGKDVGKKSFTREDINYSKIPAEDKITLASGEIISKYDSLDYLKSTDEELKKGPREDRLEKSDYSKMWQWIGTKETKGEKHYGNPPFIEKEKENDRENTDYESIADKDKITLASGEIISKYDSLDYLKSTDKELRKGPRKDRLEKSDYSKMWQWIGTKETMGEKHYGEPPRINEPTRENDPEILAKQDLDEKQEIDRINNLAYEMTYKMDQLDPDKDQEKIAELKAQYMKEIEEPGSTVHAALPQKEGELSAEEKDAIESQRVRELIYQLHYRSRELDPELDSKKLRDLNQEYLQEVANPNSTSFAPIANQEPSVEEREYAEALEKEKMEDQRLEALVTELSVSLLELDIANDGNTIWNKIEQAIKEVDNPESAIESEGWEQQKQAELERLSNLLERHAALGSPMDKEQDLSSDRQDQENTNFWEELLSGDQPQDKEMEKDKDLEKSAAENQDRQDELNPDESPAEKLLDFEKIFEQFKEMLEQHMKEEAERQRKEEEEREKQEKEEREREQGGERDEG